MIYYATGSGVNNHIYHSCIFVNDECEYNTNGHTIGQQSNQVTIQGMGFIYLNTNDNVTLRVKDVEDTTSGSSYIGNVNLVRVGI